MMNSTKRNSKMNVKINQPHFRANATKQDSCGATVNVVGSVQSIINVIELLIMECLTSDVRFRHRAVDHYFSFNFTIIH